MVYKSKKLEELVHLIQKAETGIRDCAFVHVHNQSFIQALKDVEACRNILKGVSVQNLEKLTWTDIKSVYGTLLNTAKSAYESAHKAMDSHVIETITVIDDHIEKHKQEGLMPIAAEELIAEAKDLYSNDDYKKAFSYALRAEGELEKSALQQEMATKAIKTAEIKFADAESNGIGSMSVEAWIKKAHEAFKKGEYNNALDSAIKSGNALHKALEEYARAIETTGMVRKGLVVLGRIGGTAPEIEDILNEVTNAMSIFDYNTANEKSMDAYDTIKQISCVKTGERIVSGYKLLDKSACMGVDVVEGEKLLDEAKMYLDNLKFEKACEYADKALAFAENMLGRGTETNLITAINTANTISSKLRDVKGLEQLVQTLELNKYHPEAQKALKELYQSIPALLPDYVKK